MGGGVIIVGGLDIEKHLSGTFFKEGSGNSSRVEIADKIGVGYEMGGRDGCELEAKASHGDGAPKKGGDGYLFGVGAAVENKSSQDNGGGPSPQAAKRQAQSSSESEGLPTLLSVLA